MTRFIRGYFSPVISLKKIVAKLLLHDAVQTVIITNIENVLKRLVKCKYSKYYRSAPSDKDINEC